MTAWLDVRDASPPLDPERDYGAWIESGPVLAWAEGGVYVARFARDRRDDGGLGFALDGDRWILQGRDRYTLEGVTHWRPLPYGPGVTP